MSPRYVGVVDPLSGAPQLDPDAPPEQPMGEGIRVNINLAPRAVLRGLFPPEQVPDLVIDAIIRWRSEVMT